MIPAQFEYHRPQSLDEALEVLAGTEDAKILAGGHSLLPAMKLRLARPQALVDLGRVPELKEIRQDGAELVIGAMATHQAIEDSELLRNKCPLLPEIAAVIGDAQVRNRGTIGGSIVHADPAADWPAAIVALDAQMEVLGPEGSRTIPASEFFVEMMQSAVQPNEILTSIRVRPTASSVAYVKFAQKASGFAIVGVAAIIDSDQRQVRLGITGAATKAFRAAAAEEVLDGKSLTPDNIRQAVEKADGGVETLNDIHASAEYRAHLIRVNTRRAIDLALSRA
jgi:carbon-monoxide dehydrogenase medium subunit